MAKDRTRDRKQFDEKMKRLDYIRTARIGTGNLSKADRIDKALFLIRKAQQLNINIERTADDIRKMSSKDISLFIRQINHLIYDARGYKS